MSIVGTLLKEDVATLESTFSTAARLVVAGDWAGWAELFAEDAVIHPPNGPAVHGRENIRRFGEAFPPIKAFTRSNVSVSGEGNLAYGTCSYTLTVNGLPADNGKELVVFCRGANGWQAVAASFNSDLPQAAPMP